MTNRVTSASPRVVPPVASAEPGVSYDPGPDEPNAVIEVTAKLAVAVLAAVALWQIGKRVLG